MLWQNTISKSAIGLSVILFVFIFISFINLVLTSFLDSQYSINLNNLPHLGQ